MASFTVRTACILVLFAQIGVGCAETLVLLSRGTSRDLGFSTFRQGNGHASFLSNPSRAIAYFLNGKAGAGMRWCEPDMPIPTTATAIRINIDLLPAAGAAGPHPFARVLDRSGGRTCEAGLLANATTELDLLGGNKTKWNCWGGSAGKVPSFAVHTIIIGVELFNARASSSGVLRIAAPLVAVVPGPPAFRYAWTLRAYPHTSAGVMVLPSGGGSDRNDVGPTASYVAMVRNRVRISGDDDGSAAPTTVSWAVHRHSNADPAAVVAQGNATVAVGPWKDMDVTIAIPDVQSGFYGVAVRLQGPTAGDHMNAASSLTALPPMAAATSDAFGMNAVDPQDAGAMALLGVSGVRVFTGWKFLQNAPDAYAFDLVDGRVAAAEAAGLDVLLNVKVLPPSFLESLASCAKPDWPAEGAWPGYFALLALLARRYGGAKVTYEIGNEPDGLLQKQCNLTAAEGGALYARLLSGAYAAVKGACPVCAVAAIDVAQNHDEQQNMSFTKAVITALNGSLPLDVYSPHPYNSPRSIPHDTPPGGHARPQMPCDGINASAGSQVLMADKMRVAMRLAEAMGAANGSAVAPPRVFFGETGFALGLDQPLLSNASLQFAAAVAQSMVIFQETANPAATGARLFWFAGHGEVSSAPYTTNQSYGIFRGGPGLGGPSYALPAGAAFATVARLLARTAFAGAWPPGADGGPPLPGNVSSRAFVPTAGAAAAAFKAVVCLWAPGGAFVPVEPARHPALADATRWVGALGEELEPATTAAGGAAVVAVSWLPVFALIG